MWKKLSLICNQWSSTKRKPALSVTGGGLVVCFTLLLLSFLEDVAWYQNMFHFAVVIFPWGCPAIPKYVPLCCCYLSLRMSRDTNMRIISFVPGRKNKWMNTSNWMQSLRNFLIWFEIHTVMSDTKVGLKHTHTHKHTYTHTHTHYLQAREYTSKRCYVEGGRWN